MDVALGEATLSFLINEVTAVLRCTDISFYVLTNLINASRYNVPITVSSYDVLPSTGTRTASSAGAPAFYFCVPTYSLNPFLALTLVLADLPMSPLFFSILLFPNFGTVRTLEKGAREAGTGALSEALRERGFIRFKPSEPGLNRQSLEG